jgi:pyridoxal phosphate-dependent aminotransferase EpsN
MSSTNASRLFLSPPHMSGEERELVQAVFDSNWVAPIGPMVDRFEELLAAYTGMPHVAALSSGTAALHLALRLSGIQQSDPVWCSTMTFIGGVAPISYVGAEPVFFDVSESDLLMDLDLVEERLRRGPPPRAIITTDIYGNAVSPGRMRDLRDRYGFVWISDTAEALGSRREGAHAGDGADYVIHSFNGNKIITTSGGGALAGPDGEVIAQARFLATQARDPAPHYEHSTYGYNYRLSNICAAIGVGQMAVIEDRVATRRRIWAAYKGRLGRLPGIRFDDADAHSRPNRWLTTLSIDPVVAGATREEVRLTLERQNIESRPMWKPMHLQPVYAAAAIEGSGEVARGLFDTGLCLPSGSAMSDGDIDRVCSTVERVFAR